MNRRQLIFSLGAVTSGAGLAFGTGAFTAAELSDRQVSVAVSNDAQGLIALVPNDELHAVRLENGELVIGLEDPGVSQKSVYQFGYLAEEDGVSVSPKDDFPYTQKTPSAGSDDFGSAFLLRNQTASEREIELDFELTTTDDESGSSFDTSLWFEIHDKSKRIDLFSGDYTNTVSLGSGEALGVSFILDVPDDTLGEKIEGSLTISAGETAV